MKLLSSRRDSANQTNDCASIFPRTHRLAFALVTSLFFVWGISNNLTDILVQQFRKSLELSPLAAQLVQTAVFFGYFFMALPAALAMRRWGYKVGIVAGLCLFGAGTLLLWPAAAISRYAVMLAALFLVGCGSATLETAANPMIAQFGPPATAERRLNFAQAFNPPGTIAGVVIGTFFIFSGIELSPAQVALMRLEHTYLAYLHTEIMRVVPTYVALGCIVLFLAAAIALTRFPAAADLQPPNSVEDTGSVVAQIRDLLRIPSLRAAILAQFFYCGAQVSTWSAFIPYVKQYTPATERAAGLFLIANLIAFAAGRLVSTALMRWFAPVRMMALYALINIALLALVVTRPGRVGTAAIIATSFFMSILFPTIFASGVAGLGPRTKLAGSLLVMSAVGAGILPPLVGLVARHSGSYALGYLPVACCYPVVAVYALRQTPRAGTASVSV